MPGSRAGAARGSREAEVKPRLLILELWGVGDLAMASDFLLEASRQYETTVLAKPHARVFRERFWPEVELVEFTAPWTPFRGKYRLWSWPWRELAGLRRELRGKKFDIAVSARPDPRDHWVMWHSGAGRRIGFPRAGGGMFLTESLELPGTRSHRYDHWRLAAEALRVSLPAREAISRPGRDADCRRIVVHTGAARDPRVWPLDRYVELVRRLREAGHEVDFLCDERQRERLGELGEAALQPASIRELIDHLDRAAVFVGNDSGPGHLAALSGARTFTIYGPVLPEMFGPLHPRAAAVEGSPCPWKPCLDECRFPEYRCMADVAVDRVWGRLREFLEDAMEGAA